MLHIYGITLCVWLYNHTVKNHLDQLTANQPSDMWVSPANVSTATQPTTPEAGQQMLSVIEATTALCLWCSWCRIFWQQITVRPTFQVKGWADRSNTDRERQVLQSRERQSGVCIKLGTTRPSNVNSWTRSQPVTPAAMLIWCSYINFLRKKEIRVFTKCIILYVTNTLYFPPKVGQ